MAKSTTSVKRKKKGRPARLPTGKAAEKILNFRASDEEIAQIDKWAKSNNCRDRSAAIRAMIEMVLRSTKASQH